MLRGSGNRGLINEGKAVKLLSIQYLRGIAALFIVFYHISIQLYRLGYHGNPFLFFSAGVDIFFVISGFVMWYTTFDRNIGPQEFIRHRIIRVVPLYWLITSLYLIILSIKPSLLQSAKFSLSHVIKSFLFIPASHPVSHAMWPLVIPGWTLNYEMFFYALFAITLLFARRGRAFIIIGMLLALVCLPFFAPPTNSVVAFYTSNILLEFASGVVIGYCYTSGLTIPRQVAALTTLAGVLILVVALNIGLSNVPRIVYPGIPALMIVSGAIFYERSGGIKDITFLLLLGDASYSLYLSHGAVLSAYGQIWRASGGPNISAPIIFFIFYAVGTLLTVAVGITLYHLVEQPILQKLSRRSSRKLARIDASFADAKEADEFR